MSETAMTTTTPAPLLAITSVADAERFAKIFAESTLVPQHLRGKPADAFLVILTGSELGFGLAASLRGIDIVEGKARMSARLMVAVVMRSGLCEYFEPVETTDQRATFETKRLGREPKRHTYTIETAKAAGLVDRGKDEYAKANNNWRRHPAAMLRARCMSDLAGMVYPDALFGVIASEVAEDDADDAPPPAAFSPPTPTAPLPDAVTKPRKAKEKAADAKPPEANGKPVVDVTATTKETPPPAAPPTEAAQAAGDTWPTAAPAPKADTDTRSPYTKVMDLIAAAGSLDELRKVPGVAQKTLTPTEMAQLRPVFEERLREFSARA